MSGNGETPVGARGGCLGPALAVMALAVALVLGRGLPGTMHGEKPPQALTSGAKSAPADAPETMHRVETATLRGRAGPSARSAVVRTLSRGDRVRVVRRAGRWLEVAQGGQSFWVARRYVVPAASRGAGERRSSARFRASVHGASYRARGVSGAVAHARRVASGRGRHKKRRRARGYEGYGSSGSCPCSGSRVCIGPRGGRYCITSGGNKRYGV